jgi:hypothetical protein
MFNFLNNWNNLSGCTVHLYEKYIKHVFHIRLASFKNCQGNKKTINGFKAYPYPYTLGLVGNCFYAEKACSYSLLNCSKWGEKLSPSSYVHDVVLLKLRSYRASLSVALYKAISWREQGTFLWNNDVRWVLDTLVWIFMVLAHWNNSP